MKPSHLLQQWSDWGHFYHGTQIGQCSLCYQKEEQKQALATALAGATVGGKNLYNGFQQMSNAGRQVLARTFASFLMGKHGKDCFIHDTAHTWCTGKICTPPNPSTPGKTKTCTTLHTSDAHWHGCPAFCLNQPII